MARAPLVQEDPLRIDDYWLAGRLGAGGQAVVYEAYDRAGRRFAVKVLRSGGGFGPPAQREVEAAARVPPFCTAKVVTAKLTGDRPYIVSEFVDGPSLAAAVAEHGPLSGDALHRLAVGIITAVAAIHQAGVVHRDLKPGNVVLGPDGPRVIDFGIARVLAEWATASHAVAGTLKYMAPEQLNGQRVGPAADVHSWATTVLFAATGRHTFGGGTDGEIINAVCHTMPDLGGLPATLRPLVAAALAKNPSDRPTAVEVLVGLICVDPTGAGSRILSSIPVSQTEPSDLVRQPVAPGGDSATTDDGHLPVAVDTLLQAGRGEAEQTLTPSMPGRSVRPIGLVAEEVFEALTGEQRQVLVQVLLRMLEPEPDGGVRPRSVQQRDLPLHAGSVDLQVVVQRLADAELVTRDGDRLSLSSAALPVAWPRLGQWLAEEGDGLRVLSRLHAAARFWREHGERDGDLLQGSLLEQATVWAATGRARAVLSRLERGFLDASRRLHTLRDRRRRIVTAVLAGLVVLLLLASAGLVAFSRAADAERRRANEQRDIAMSRQLAAQSQTIAVRDPVLSRFLAAAAWRIYPTVEAKASMSAALLNPARALLAGHRNTVNAVVFSPDGTRVATASSDGTARIWEADTSELVFELEGHTDEVTSVAFSPDGTRLASVSWDGTARLWDVDTGEPAATLTGPNDQLTYVAFSSDGNRLATGSINEARVWDIDAGEPVFELTGQAGQLISVAFSQDGTRLVTSLYGEDEPNPGDPTVQVWEVEAGEPVAELIGHTGRVGSVVFSPDGSRVATGSADGTARVWDGATGEQLFELTGHSDAVMSMAFSPDAQLVATGSADGTARVWDGATGEQLAELAATRAVTSMAFSPDGAEVVTASNVGGGPETADATVRVWDAAAGEQVAEFVGHTGPVTSVVFSPDGTQVAGSSFDRTARVWDLATSGPIAELTGLRHDLTSVAFSPDGTRLAAATFNASAHVWSVDSGESVAELPRGLSVINARALNQDGTQLAVVGFDAAGGNTARVWDVGTGELIADLSHPDFLEAVVFSPDGARLATDSIDGTPRVWDVDTGELVAELTDRSGMVDAMVFSPDGTRLATVSGLMETDTGGARVWDAATGEQVTELTGHTNAAHSVVVNPDGTLGTMVFSPDGTKLAIGSGDGTARVWDAATGEQLVHLAGHTAEMTSVAFSSDGTRVATSSDDGTARVWDAATGEELFQLIGHTGGVGSAVFSPDGTRLATAGTDGTARVWDTATGVELVQLAGHPGPVTSLAFSPDGRRVATASTDRTVRVWGLAFDVDPYPALCERLGRTFSEEEWRVHIPDYPYQAVCT